MIVSHAVNAMPSVCMGREVTYGTIFQGHRIVAVFCQFYNNYNFIILYYRMLNYILYRSVMPLWYDNF